MKSQRRSTGTAFQERCPTFDELNWPALKAVMSLGGSGSISEHLPELIKQEHIPNSVAIIPHGETGRTELEYRLAWARTTLKRAGFLDNSSRGVWSVTEAGEAANVAHVKAQVARLRVEYSENSTGTTISEAASAKFEKEVDWRDDLLRVLRSMSPDAFERLCQRLLRESGFIKVEVTGRSGDGGIDGTGILQLSLMSFHVLFQCKRYQGSVGSSAIRDFRGAMQGRSDKGLVITTGTFSTDARREATRDGAPPIDLIDGISLCEHLKKLGLGIDTQLVEEVRVNSDWFAQL